MDLHKKYDPKAPLELSALRAVRAARWFVEDWWETAAEAEELCLGQVVPTLERLASGDLFNDEDEEIFEELEQAIIDYLNDLRDGYGTYAIKSDTHYDELFCPVLGQGRVLIERWKAFRHARQHLVDLKRARVIVEQFA